ncbi:MAG: hypothetical protein H6739_14590 [Alphaproteobacteria bacterium]|nr:hypothetical protein [Alphaproteobacteria bacterium]
MLLFLLPLACAPPTTTTVFPGAGQATAVSFEGTASVDVEDAMRAWSGQLTYCCARSLEAHPTALRLRLTVEDGDVVSHEIDAFGNSDEGFSACAVAKATAWPFPAGTNGVAAVGFDCSESLEPG